MRSAPRCIEGGGCELWVVTSPCEVRKCFKGENSCHGNLWFRSLSESKNNNCHCKDKQVKLILVQFILNFIFFIKAVVAQSNFLNFPSYVTIAIFPKSHSPGIHVQECLLCVSVFALFDPVVFVLWLLMWSLTCGCVESSAVHVTCPAWRTEAGS